jgi:hypothetical protein
MYENKERTNLNKEIEISKPHIEGNEGYPPRPEPTKEEAL